MSEAAAQETHGFQAEVKQLLHLMVHSLYSNREIFLRELISNASDAADRLRFESLTKKDLLAEDTELQIELDWDSDAGTITVSDNGIGMSREEVIRQLGTIAKSGTGEFLNQLSGDQKQDANLIGQFGVGFYSAFIVADRVEVLTRRAGDSEAVRWVSDGQGEFSVESVEKKGRGTAVILHLREDAQEFADQFRLRNLVSKYSDHIAFPVVMRAASGEEEGEAAQETVNSARALWTRPRTEISEEEYREFYRHISHDFQDPLTWSHNRVEGKREYTSLLYIPARAPFDLYNRESPRGLKLYVQRVFIMDDAEQFLPLYLRFVRGVLDSSDFSLNVSREILQQDANVEAIRPALAKRVLSMLDKLAKDDPEEYQKFWNEFGRVLKEGPAEDSTNKDRVAELLRFTTTHTDSETQDQSLSDYQERMKPDQPGIYYIVGETFNAAKASPHLEALRAKGIEVLLLSEAVDEWLISHLSTYQELPFQDVTRGELDLSWLPDTDEEDQSTKEGESEQGHQELIDRVKESLGERIADARTTTRLTDSPACLALGEFDMGLQMRKVMEASGQSLPDSKPIFELNPQHPLVERLRVEPEGDRFDSLVQILFDQAGLAEGRLPDDPGSYVQRLNRLLLEIDSG